MKSASSRASLYRSSWVSTPNMTRFLQLAAGRGSRYRSSLTAFNKCRACNPHCRALYTNKRLNLGAVLGSLALTSGSKRRIFPCSNRYDRVASPSQRPTVPHQFQKYRSSQSHKAWVQVRPLRTQKMPDLQLGARTAAHPMRDSIRPDRAQFFKKKPENFCKHPACHNLLSPPVSTGISSIRTRKLSCMHHT